jgi:uncharacterized protein YegP (UPF0339 family)
MKFAVYTDKRGRHRWNLKSGNQRIMGDSGQGYKTRGGALRAVARIQKGILGAKIVQIGR